MRVCREPPARGRILAPGYQLQEPDLVDLAQREGHWMAFYKCPDVILRYVPDVSTLSDAAAVRGDGATDCRVTGGDGLDGGGGYRNPRSRRQRTERSARKLLERWDLPVSGFRSGANMAVGGAKVPRRKESPRAGSKDGGGVYTQLY